MSKYFAKIPALRYTIRAWSEVSTEWHRLVLLKMGQEIEYALRAAVRNETQVALCGDDPGYAVAKAHYLAAVESEKRRLNAWSAAAQALEGLLP